MCRLGLNCCFSLTSKSYTQTALHLCCAEGWSLLLQRCKALGKGRNNSITKKTIGYVPEQHLGSLQFTALAQVSQGQKQTSLCALVDLMCSIGQPTNVVVLSSIEGSSEGTEGETSPAAPWSNEGSGELQWNMASGSLWGWGAGIARQKKDPKALL